MIKYFKNVTLLFFMSFACIANVSQQQIEQFKKLSPAQQQALAKNMGVDLNSLNLGSLNKPPQQVQPSLDDLVSPRKVENKNLATEPSKVKALSLFDKKTASNKLKPFGYDLFAGEPSTFAPVTDTPISMTYKLGPGDRISIKLYGKETDHIDLTIDPQGNIFFPKIGPVNLAGQSFSDAKNHLQNIIKERKIGVQASISMGELRAIRIFVLGEAYKPASYTLSSLATVTQALYAAGGVNNIGSLRNIQVKRQGKIVTSFDLYDLLLKGDTSNDINLSAGDVVFIPTVGKTVGIKGGVTRPAIYELKNEQSIAELLSLAGGLLPTAFERIVKVERINSNGLRSVININLNEKNQSSHSLKSHYVIHNGDVLDVASVSERLEQSVIVQGHVTRAGTYGWQPNMMLSDLLTSIYDFKEQPDLSYILITRKNPITGEVSSLDVDYSSYIKYGKTSVDFELQAQDTIYVFDKENNRADNLLPLIELLTKQTVLNELPQVAEVIGAVKNPGVYPLTQDSSVTNLLRAAMGSKKEAETSFAILARKSQELTTHVLYIDLNDTSDRNMLLKPSDRLFIFDKNEDRNKLLTNLNAELINQANKRQAQNIIQITGDVKFPGKYPYVNNMTPHQLVTIAGGYTESSYLVNAELTRFNHDGIESADITHGIVDLSNKELFLQPLDTLRIKRIPEWREQRVIELLGEVVFPGRYVLQKGETLQNVIQRAGGLTTEADAKAAVFTREVLRQKEQKEIIRLGKELEGQAALLTLDNDDKNAIAADEADQLVERLKNTKAVGRLVINLPELLVGNLAVNVRLDDGDALYIPKVRQSISVMGEVQYSASHLYSEYDDVDDYITRSGGMKARADKKRIYIIKANGSVLLVNEQSWFETSASRLSAGDTIVVPLDLEYRDTLDLWSIATQIMYNTAVSIAAIGAI
jgi:protein involved in polysaccharide export with SLBB domain